MYNQTVLDHFENPRNLRELKNPTATGMGASKVCGDVMTLFLNVQDGTIRDASFQTVGCGAAIASGSLLTELLRGKSIEDARKLSADNLTSALGGLPKIKLHCPELVIEALRAALRDYDTKK